MTHPHTGHPAERSTTAPGHGHGVVPVDPQQAQPGVRTRPGRLRPRPNSRPPPRSLPVVRSAAPVLVPEDEAVRVSVDNNRCHIYGICQQEAPEVFRISEGGSLHYTRAVPAEFAAKARQATRCCPCRRSGSREGAPAPPVPQANMPDVPCAAGRQRAQAASASSSPARTGRAQRGEPPQRTRLRRGTRHRRRGGTPPLQPPAPFQTVSSGELEAEQLNIGRGGAGRPLAAGHRDGRARPPRVGRASAGWRAASLRRAGRGHRGGRQAHSRSPALRRPDPHNPRICRTQPQYGGRWTPRTLATS